MSSNTAPNTATPTCTSPGATALSAGGGGSLGKENDGVCKVRARHAALIVDQTKQLAQQQAQQLTAQTARIEELEAALAAAVLPLLERGAKADGESGVAARRAATSDDVKALLAPAGRSA